MTSRKAVFVIAIEYGPRERTTVGPPPGCSSGVHQRFMSPSIRLRMASADAFRGVEITPRSPPEPLGHHEREQRFHDVAGHRRAAILAGLAGDEDLGHHIHLR